MFQPVNFLPQDYQLAKHWFELAAANGVEGLRVVDASIFPKIPGMYIVAAIYMASEKAADVIIQAAKASS